MAVSVEVPNFGEDMAGGLVAEWYRADGALVGLGEIVCRIEGSFVAFEVEAEGEGTLRHQKPAGSIERAGAVLGVILAAGEAMPSASPVLPRRGEPGVVAVVPPHAEAVEEPEIEDEFEQALAEAVVVPFPRRFTPNGPGTWEAKPGDATEVEPAAWDGSVQERIEALAEPGGSIPGLPLWDPDEAAAESAPVPQERFERIAAAAAADAQVLQAAISIETTEASRLAAVCAREWRAVDPPSPEDVLFRAIAFALRDASGADTPGAFVIAEQAADVSGAVAHPAGRPFREAVVARHAGGDAGFESASWLLVSLARLGVLSCTPRLEHGRRVAFAVGAPDASGRATFTMAFDSLAWSEGSAARLLARIRELYEAPYAMLV